MIDKTILDGIIIGRVEPHIYAFSTNTIPNYGRYCGDYNVYECENGLIEIY